MGILKVLFENNVRITKYYSKQDFSTNFLIRDLVDNYELIESYFSENYPYQKITLTEFTDHLWINLISPLEEILKDLDDELSQKLESILHLLKSINYYPLDIRTFIKNNYEVIFDEKSYPDILISHDIMDETLNDIYKVYDFYDRKVFEYIEINKLNWIIQNFKECEKYYEKNIDYFKLLMLNNSQLFEVNRFFYTFESLSVSKKPFIVEFIQSKAEEVLKEIILLVENINEDNYMFNIIPIEQINKIVLNNRYKFVDLYKLEGLKEKIKDVEQKYMKKHGKSFSFGPIDFKGIYDDYVNNFKKDNGIVYYVEISHFYSIDEKRFNSNFKPIFNRPKSLTDELAFTPGTDDYFTGSRLMNLSMEVDLRKRILYYLLGNYETKNHMYNFMLSILATIDQNEFNGESIMVDYFDSFFPTLMHIILDETQETLDIYFKSTSLIMFLISIMEMLLRRVVINRNKGSIYYSDNDFNLGDLLKTKQNNGNEYEDNILVDIFGIEFVRTLEYFLTKTNDTNIGENLRNNLMHNRNYDFKNNKNGIVLHVYYVFINLVNAILVNYWNDNLKKDN